MGYVVPIQNFPIWDGHDECKKKKKKSKIIGSLFPFSIVEVQRMEMSTSQRKLPYFEFFASFVVGREFTLQSRNVVVEVAFVAYDLN